MGSFGEDLRREREARGITLEDISAVTKISVRLLEAIENEQFERLPGGVFNVNFVRQYARQLGLDEEEVVAGYRRLAAPPPEPAEQQAPPIPAEWARTDTSDYDRERKRQPARWVAAALVVAVLGLAWHLWRSGRNTTSAKQPPPLSVAKRAPAVASAPAPEPPPEPPKATPVEAPAAEPAEKNLPADAPVRVEIEAVDYVWVSVHADGQPLFAATLSPGNTRIVTAGARVLLKVSNAARLRVRLNGTEQPPLGANRERVTVVLSPQGMQVESSPPTPPDTRPSN
jgi:cytoskeletal protein RodZ